MSKQRPIEGARLELGGRSVLGFSGIGLPGGESIFFPEISGYGKHLSIYFPTPGQIATHITHQYPLGRKLRTRRRKTDLGKLMRKIMHSIAPADDPPPHASFFGETGRGEWRAWLGRTLPKIA